MALAVDAAGSRLKVFSEARRRPEMQKALLDMITELKAAGIDEKALESASEGTDGVLSDNYSTFPLCTPLMRRLFSRGRADPSDRLKNLALSIAKSSVGTAAIYT
jgi:ATP-dependent helicase/DNAse subunit B